MIFTVDRTSNFASLIVTDGGATLDSGLLNDNERRDLVESLLRAAEELTPQDYDSFNEYVCQLYQIKGAA